MSTKEMQETAAALDVSPVQAQASFQWTVNLYEHQGKCYLHWSTTAPFRAQKGKIVLYANSFPSNPNDRVIAWTWDDRNKNPFNTGQTWGSGWCAAYIAESSPDGPYVYFVKTAVTK
jgi:hypothetical protein